jgi:hypothetical protein
MADDKVRVKRARRVDVTTPTTMPSSDSATRQTTRTDAARPDTFTASVSGTTPAGARARARTAATLQRSLGNGRAGHLMALLSPATNEMAAGRAAQDHPQPAPAPVAQRSAVTDVLRTPGRPLGSQVRAEMETALGGDFSDVRLHTGSGAQRSAEEIGARAYTSGNHVVVGQGGEERLTLAHELAHVIQQGKGSVAGTDNGAGLQLSNSSDQFEQQAHITAHHAITSAMPRHQDSAPVAAIPTGGPLHTECAKKRKQRLAGDRTIVTELPSGAIPPSRNGPSVRPLSSIAVVVQRTLVEQPPSHADLMETWFDTGTNVTYHSGVLIG